MLFRVFLASATIAFSAASAQAQTTGSWTGFNLAIGGGAAKLDSSLGTTAAYDNTTTAQTPGPLLIFETSGLDQSNLDIDKWTGFFTVSAGYDKQVGSLLFGVFADFDLYPDHPSKSDTHDFLTRGIDTVVNGGVPTVVFDGTFVGGSVKSKLEVENVWSVGGRVGLLARPDLLIFGSAGYTQIFIDGRSELTFDDITETGPITRTLVTNTPDELNGYFLGIGGEWKMSAACALRLEYRYSDFQGKSSSSTFAFADNDAKFPVGDGTITTDASVRSKVDVDLHTIRAALVFKLGAETSAVSLK